METGENRKSCPLAGLINNEQRSDVCFIVGDQKKKIYAVTYILASKSPVFDAMFFGSFKEGGALKQTAVGEHMHITIPDYDPEIFLLMVKYIHLGRTELEGISTQTATELWAISDNYNVKGLEVDLTTLLLDKINLETFLVLVGLLPHLSGLRDKLVEFANANMPAFLLEPSVLVQGKSSLESMKYLYAHPLLRPETRVAVVVFWNAANKISCQDADELLLGTDFEEVRICVSKNLVGVVSQSFITKEYLGGVLKRLQAFEERRVYQVLVKLNGSCRSFETEVVEGLKVNWKVHSKKGRDGMYGVYLQATWQLGPEELPLEGIKISCKTPGFAKYFARDSFVKRGSARGWAGLFSSNQTELWMEVHFPPVDS